MLEISILLSKTLFLGTTTYLHKFSFRAGEVKQYLKYLKTSGSLAQRKFYANVKPCSNALLKSVTGEKLAFCVSHISDV